MNEDVRGYACAGAYLALFSSTKLSNSLFFSPLLRSLTVLHSLFQLEIHQLAFKGNRRVK